jgi:hypothetical protein
MAFAIRNLSVLAYANGFTLWHYKAGRDRLGLVGKLDFFADAADMLAEGDLMMVTASDGGVAASFRSHPAPAARWPRLRWHSGRSLRWRRTPQNFPRMPDRTGGRDLVAPVSPLVCQPHAGQPRQAWRILHHSRPAGRTAQREPVQCRAAAGFQVGLVPHGVMVVVRW